MKTISVREMKASWSEVEDQVRAGEEFEVLNHGKPTVRIIAASPRRVLQWDDHLVTACESKGHSAEETVRADRDGRF
jgi:prevent-host-death family protein